jgi:hypothetical protein
MPEGQRLVISYKGGMDADDGDTLVFDQGSTASPDGRFLLVTIKDGPDPDGELDFTAADGGGEAAGTYILYQDVFIPAVQHDYDLS